MVFRQRLEAIHAQKGYAAALHIIQELRSRGFLTVFAGGCVRDSLLGHTPKDLDLATAAPPDVVEETFERTLAVGKAFGTIVVVTDEAHFEVTTFRSEGPYKDGRRPEHVSFTDIEEDARRRDFTVNALYYDPLSAEILDYVGGVEDLKAKKLRTVGRAEERFQEDRLRMLRAVRFVAQLGFELEPQSLRAIQALKTQIQSVSAERIFAEIKRLLEGRYLKNGLHELLRSGLADEVWPEIQNVNLERLDAFPGFASWENVYAALMMLAEADPEPRWRAWKAPRESLRRIEEQIRGVRGLLSPSSTRPGRARILGGDLLNEILNLASGLTKEPQKLEAQIQEFLQIADEQGALPEPFITGQDLIRLGFAPGARMGEILKKMFDEQLEGRIRSKQEALKRIEEFSKA